MDDASLAEEYVRGFVLEQLAENSVKREEVSPPNPNKLAAWVQATSTVVPLPIQQQQQQQQSQHPSNTNHSQSIAMEYGVSRGVSVPVPTMNGHRQSASSGKFMNVWHSPPDYNGGPMAEQAVLVNTPSTPPETPPVSGSPTSSSNCNGQAPTHLQPPPVYSPYQQSQHHRMGHHLGNNGLITMGNGVDNPLSIDEMSCYPDSGCDKGRMDIPLDLRPPHCNDLDCERRHEYPGSVYHHHMSMQPHMQQIPHHHPYYNTHPCRPLSGGSASTIISSPKRGTGSVNGFGGSVGGKDDMIDDEVLMTLTVRELNKKLHGFPREDVMRFKQKRRTLKNRGYAQNCRSKRLQQRHELEHTNRQLHNELDRIKMELSRVIQEREQLKQMLQMRSSNNGSGGNTANNNGLANGGGGGGPGNGGGGSAAAAVCQQVYGSAHQQQSSLMVTSSGGGGGGPGSHSNNNNHVNNNHSPSPETYL